MKSPSPRFLSTVTSILLILAAFLVGYNVNGNHAGSGIAPVWASNSRLEETSLKPVQLFQDALTAVQAKYVDPITNSDQLTYAAIRGMLAEIHDPYTRFMDPKELKDFNNETEGHFAGIGATLKMTELPALKNEKGEVPKESVTCPICGTKITDLKLFRITVVEPLPGSPAKVAGILPGDNILKVNGVSTEGMTVSDTADKIRGPEGTKVTLSIERNGSDKPFDMTITRADIEVPAVQQKILEGNIGYLRLYSFNEKTVPETRSALLDFEKAHIRGLVLDLRSNPGGLLTECVHVASMLLPPENKVIVSTKGRDRMARDEVRVDSQLYRGPMVVLVNKGSASASEILTGALKDYHRATIIGETTFGKALVQTVIPLGDRDNLCAMPVTTARYYTPSGYDLNKKGITPDKVVELSKDAKEIDEKDNQATEALKLLKEEIEKVR